MGTKKNNHLLPRMVIKRWEEHNGKIFDKETNQIREVEQLDYSKEYYYSLGKVDDELENRISVFEGYIGRILKQLNEATDKVELSEKDMEILKLYACLQSCRNDSTSSYINEDESGIYQNNNYIFGTPVISTQDEAVKLTTLICDEFERIKKLDNNMKYNYNYRFMNFGGINSMMVMGLHLVIVGNDSNEFLVSETTAVVECTLDGDYLFTYVPVSPKIGLILAKSKYFYTKDEIENTKVRLGMKYGGWPDPYLSEVLDDEKLIFYGKPNSGKVTFKIVKLDITEIVKLNTVIYEDGHKILFSNEDALKNAKIDNDSRKVRVA
ncbi:MAG: DUF4238 domain-containing protein [Bacilli bacterium]